MGLIIGQGTKSGGGGGGASAAEKALVQNATQYGLSHNLYAVMEDVKKDPRTSGYAAIMLCQYYKGYNSLSLEGGADAFLTSDGDFYQGNAVHYWHDSNDEHFDRWVAMLFSSNSGSYTCSNANICPRAALIDGTMGDINVSPTAQAAMRFQWIDVTDGSSYGQLYSSNLSGKILWLQTLTLNGMRKISRGGFTPIINLSGAIFAKIGVREIANVSFCDTTSGLISADFYNLERISGNGCLFGSSNGNQTAGVKIIKANELKTATRLFYTSTASNLICANIVRLECKKLTSITTAFTNITSATFPSLIHIEIGDGFNANLNLKMCSFANCLKTDANDLVEEVHLRSISTNKDQWLYNFEHLIVDKLADLSGQTAKTITLAAAPYAAITESIRAKMSAKNWNLASA